ncbi:hypothetical protein BDV96DRAFT_494249 [Lophiotrema nucula]|uniref:KANL3/Tex30 alpha/beta hydrolase-like domain-containing protein n=1 Tax=Lophiotrema nucula TaxID=690887 RepID=A0A6A5Z755_9PLEO|nr:hypothetical protein BDV96DRAFT_494249 [Lophiotrema nucula]
MHDTSKGDLIFTHGAGGTLSAPAVVNFVRGYAESSPVLAFQGSMNLAARVKGFLALISNNDGKKGSMLRFGGRSMGARAAVMAASQIIEGGFEEKVELVLVSYPLKGPKGDLRDEILLSLPKGVAARFIIGDKDNMCPLNELAGVRLKMKAQTSLLVVKGADHGMHVRPAPAEEALGEMTGSWAAERKGTGSDEQIWWDGDAEEVKRGPFKS